jgi:aspartate/methionine/tyrosine aminotransferase
MPKLTAASRIQSMPVSIFTTISKMALEYEATNLGQGFPDFDGPDWIPEKAFEAMKAGKNQYAPSPGIFSLRRNIANIQKKYYWMDYDPDSEITITAGATEALYCAIEAIIEPGDEVLLFEPFYDAYQANIMLAGGVPRYVTLHKPDFSFDREEFASAITDDTKMIILNTPHNPTGKVFSEDELDFIAKIAVDHNLVVLADEVYEFLLFGESRHIPIANYKGMRDRTITISSTGKTFGMTGWKIGYATAGEKLTDAIRKVHQWTTFAVNTPGQHAMAYAFSVFAEYLVEFRDIYNKKRKILLDGLGDTVFTPHDPGGTYFMMADIPDGRFANDVEAATVLIREFGVAAIPPSVFYANSREGESMLRFCFAKNDDTLHEGIEKLKKVRL